MRSRPGWFVAAGLLVVLGQSPARASPIFNLSFIAGTSVQARPAFQQAASVWAFTFSDTVAINLTVGTGSLASGILASTGSAETAYAYTDFRTALTNDVTSATDVAAMATVPAGASLSPSIKDTADNPHGSGSAAPYVDTTGNNTSVIRMTGANAKALGLRTTSQIVIGCASACDGLIGAPPGACPARVATPAGRPHVAEHNIPQPTLQPASATVLVALGEAADFRKTQ